MRVSDRARTRAQKRQTRFADAAVALLRELGAVANTDEWAGMYNLTLDTPAGRFLLHPSELAAGSAHGTLFGRFVEPKRSKAAGYGCNPYSGKMNVHLGELRSLQAAEDAAAVAVREMARRLRLPTPTLGSTQKGEGV